MGTGNLGSKRCVKVCSVCVCVKMFRELIFIRTSGAVPSALISALAGGREGGACEWRRDVERSHIEAKS